MKIWRVVVTLTLVACSGGDIEPPARSNADVTADQVRIIDGLYTVTVGNGAEAVVVLHGGPGLRHSYLRPEWDQLLPAAKVVYYDQRGCGQSTREGPLGWKQHVRDLHRIIEVVAPGRPVVIAGSSWGSTLALLYAATHPENVRSLVLSGLPPWERIDSIRARYLAASPGEQQIQRLIASRAEFDPLAHTSTDSSDIAREATDSSGLAQRLGEHCHLPFGVVFRSLYDAPGSAELSSVTLPVLILQEEHPDGRGSGAASMAAVLPGSTLLFVPGAGHDPWFDRTEFVMAAIMTYLRELSLPI